MFFNEKGKPYEDLIQKQKKISFRVAKHSVNCPKHLNKIFLFFCGAILSASWVGGCCQEVLAVLEAYEKTLKLDKKNN